MTRRISGPAKEEPGRAYLLKTAEFRNYVDDRRSEALRGIADLRAEIEGYNHAIERRNADATKANEIDATEIAARESHIEDLEQVIAAADAALQASAK